VDLKDWGDEVAIPPFIPDFVFQPGANIVSGSSLIVAQVVIQGNDFDITLLN
jgi:hypothetical protein